MRKQIHKEGNMIGSQILVINDIYEELFIDSDSN